MAYDFYQLPVDPAAPLGSYRCPQFVAPPARFTFLSGNVAGVLRRPMRFVGGSVLAFMVIFSVANAQAYLQVVNSRVSAFLGAERPTFVEEQVAVEQPVEANAPEQKIKIVQKDPVRKVLATADLSVIPPDNRIVIPRIGRDVPIVEVGTENLIKNDWNALEEDIQTKLKEGVVRYPGTAIPGNGGNTFLTGHSSFYLWDDGRFKDVFALLPDMQVGDKIYLYYDQKRFVYEVTETKEVKPDEIDVLKQTDHEQLTLMTCVPLGTNLRRFIVIAKPV